MKSLSIQNTVWWEGIVHETAYLLGYCATDVLVL